MGAMNNATRCPIDFRLVFHGSPSDAYEMSQVLLATADFEGTLQLLTSGWERVLGYSREELKGKTLVHLVWSDRRAAAAAVAAILDTLSMAPVDLRVRCRNGRGKCLRLNRLYDKRGHRMHIVAEEIADHLTGFAGDGKERRMAVRHA
jgi:PAS domain S-box-containing protein